MAPPDFAGKQLTAGTFRLAVDGVDIGTFREVHGLQVDVSVEVYAEGGQNGFEHRFPGRMTWPNIVLKRGVTNSDNLFSWLQEVSGDGFAAAGNKLERNTGAITLLGSDGTPLRSWNVEGAFPVRWSGPELATGAADVADEELEIAHHGFRAENH
ncbi:MAG: phage tail protein [Acidimicrobiia bacterium]